MSTEQPKEASFPAVENLTLQEKILKSVEVSDQALTQAAEREKQAAEKQAEVKELIPQVVETLVKHKRIEPHQREKLAEMLEDPAETLRLMEKVAGHRNQDELAHLGTGLSNGQEKKASQYDPSKSVSDPYVGRKTSELKQSDIVLYEKLGLALPTE